MDIEAEALRYAEEPDLLLDLCQQVLERLDARAGGQETAQLKVISAAIEQLERQGVPVPDALQTEKSRLAATLEASPDTREALALVVDGLHALIGETRSRLEVNRSGRSRTFRVGTTPDLSRTPRETWRRLILEVLETRGGQAMAASVLADIEERMQGSFLPGDLEMVKNGVNVMVLWKKSVTYERYLMVQECLLRNDSPKGLWELNK